jgi:hypothetical protein
MAEEKSPAPLDAARKRASPEPDPFILSLELATKLLEQLHRFADDSSLGDTSMLLGKNDGLIDGFNSLSAALARVLDRDPKRADDTKPQTGGAVPDDQEIRQRITAELDRLAARGRARGDGSDDRADPGGAAETAAHVGGLESAT